MMLKIWRELPDMYIMIAFMGSAFAGARASSQDFFILSVSVSSGLGAFRSCVLEAAERYEGAERLLAGPAGSFCGCKEALALPPEDAEYPGGSGMLALVLGFGGE